MGIINFFKKSRNEIKEEISFDKEVYKKVKNLSYWIFNNYGIPVIKVVNISGNDSNIKLANSLPFKEVESKMLLKIIDEYLCEYSGQKISIEEPIFASTYSENFDTIFKLEEKNIYTEDEYNFLKDKFAYNSQLFLFFDFEKLNSNSISSEIKDILSKAKEKTKDYQNDFKDLNKPKLINRCPGLSFAEYKLKEIKEEALEKNISFEENYEIVKSEVQEILKNKFIPLTQIYCNPLMDTVRWRMGFNYLNSSNEVIYVPSSPENYWGEN